MTSDKQRKTRARDLAAREQISYTAALRRLDTLPTQHPRTEMPVQRTAFTPAVNWDHLEQPEFDRIVEALVHRLYDAPDTQVVAYDGRGGDQGRDVVVIQGGRTRIFQLKYFRDGFGQERRTQRRQITASFNRALQHNPAEWVLVIPTNPTPGEEQFVLDHGAQHLHLKIRIMGRQELDSRLSAFPDLVSFLLRDNLREAAMIYQQERATLQDGLADLTQRHVDLQAITDTLDPDWIVDTASGNGMIEHWRQTLKASGLDLDDKGYYVPGQACVETLETAVRLRPVEPHVTSSPIANLQPRYIALHLALDRLPITRQHAYELSRQWDESARALRRYNSSGAEALRAYGLLDQP